MQLVQPEHVGLSSARLNRIDPAMQGYVDRGELAGITTLLARRGQVAHLGCYGLANLATGQPMQPDTLVRIYSMSKPVTAVAVLMLYEEGRFQLDDPIARFIPGFADTMVYAGGTVEQPQLVPQERPMTIRHLMTHTSGLSYGGGENDPVDQLYRGSPLHAKFVTDSMTLPHLVQGLAELPLAFQPGTKWRYGFSIDVLGYLVEVIAGRPFDAFLQERLFNPLGMVDTGFWVPADKVGRFAVNYGLGDGGGLTVVDDPATGSYSRPARWLSGGGGLVSTALDYFRFAQMLCNGGTFDGVRILGRKTVEMMAMNHLTFAGPFFPSTWPLNRGFGMGLGVRVVTNVAETGVLGTIGSYTWQGAASTDFWVDPQEELVGISLPQRLPGYYRQALDFRTLAYQALD